MSARLRSYGYVILELLSETQQCAGVKGLRVRGQDARFRS